MVRNPTRLPGRLGLTRNGGILVGKHPVRRQPPVPRALCAGRPTMCIRPNVTASPACALRGHRRCAPRRALGTRTRLRTISALEGRQAENACNYKGIAPVTNRRNWADQEIDPVGVTALRDGGAMRSARPHALGRKQSPVATERDQPGTLVRLAKAPPHLRRHAAPLRGRHGEGTANGHRGGSSVTGIPEPVTPRHYGRAGAQVPMTTCMGLRNG